MSSSLTVRLLRETPEALVFGGGSGWVPVGIGLLIGGIAFCGAALLIHMKTGGAARIPLAILGLPMLLGGLWAVGYKQSLELDGAARQARLMAGNRFTASEDTIPFGMIREVGLERRVYNSPSALGGHEYWVFVVRLGDGREIRIQDQDVDRDLERTRDRGRRIATFTGASFDPDPAMPD